MEELKAYRDPKQDIEFWIKALSQPNLDKASIEMLNECLQKEIEQYLNPVCLYKIKY